MALFSQRAGIRPLQKAIQRESLDGELRNALWTAFHETFVNGYYYNSSRDSFAYYPFEKEGNAWLHSVWTEFLKLPSDTKPGFREAVAQLRAEFFAAKWHWVLDFLEFSAKHATELGPLLTKSSNAKFTRENSAYRFVGTEIVEITDEREISAIEEALDSPKAARLHLTQALALLSDRRAPDFRNSVKESISAVEAICRLVSRADRDTLGAALKKISSKAPLHPAFEQALLKLYGFTSDGSGIRHSLMDESSITYGDAKFMLVLCAGFTNFLLAKCAEHGVAI